MKADGESTGPRARPFRRRAPWELWAGAALIAFALVAPLLAPAEPQEQFDPAAGRYLPPLSARYVVRLADGRRLLTERAEVRPGGLMLVRLGERRLLAPEELASPPGSEPPRRWFLLGTDRYGRDVLTRILHGARVSLSIGLLAASLALTLGLLVGGVAAMSEGLVDALLMRGVDALLVFPRLFLLLTLTALFEAGDWLVPVVLGATGWMAASRLARAEILGLKQRDWVTAARATGQRPLRIFVRHLLPGALNPLVVDTSLRIGDIILLEAALSFLGFGVQPPTPSWGNMVADGADSLVAAWWVAAFPGLAIALTAITFNLLGDRLRDLLDPRSDPARR